MIKSHNIIKIGLSLVLLASIFALAMAAVSQANFDGVKPDEMNTLELQTSGTHKCASDEIVYGFYFDDKNDKNIRRIHCIETSGIIVFPLTEEFINFKTAGEFKSGEYACSKGYVVSGIEYNIDTHDRYATGIYCKKAKNVGNDTNKINLAGNSGKLYDVFINSGKENNQRVGWAVTSLDFDATGDKKVKNVYAARINNGILGDGVYGSEPTQICEAGYEKKLSFSTTLKAKDTNYAGSNPKNGFEVSAGDYVVELVQGAYSHWERNNVNSIFAGGGDGLTWFSRAFITFSKSSIATDTIIVGSNSIYKDGKIAEEANKGRLQQIRVDYHKNGENNIWIWLKDSPINDNRNYDNKIKVNVWHCDVLPQCSNGLDDDGDGVIDLLDPGCTDAQDNSEDSATTKCQDGIDNDNDGFIDLADFGCMDSIDNDEVNNGNTQCSNGLDDDGDGFIDQADSDCSDFSDDSESAISTTPQCSDGIDNDNDGFIDLADFSCSNAQDNDEASPLAQCQNGIDDDNDGFIDLLDSDCVNSQDNDESGTIPLPQCSDGIDNDNDGLIDLADPGCSNSQDNDESNGGSGTTPQCSDGIDNDNDGYIDLEDFGCIDANDDNEVNNGNTQCSDGVDNDGDGDIDQEDTQCSDPSDDRERSSGGGGSSSGSDKDSGAVIFNSQSNLLLKKPSADSLLTGNVVLNKASQIKEERSVPGYILGLLVAIILLTLLIILTFVYQKL